MNAMSETIVENLPTLMNVVLTYTGTLIAESMDVRSLCAALTLALLAAQMFRKKMECFKILSSPRQFYP